MAPTSFDSTQLLAYAEATPVERMQAMTHAIEILQLTLPPLSLKKWVKLFEQRAPMLWKAGKIVQVDLDALDDFANWVAQYLEEKNSVETPSFEGEAYYLARNLMYYQELAQEVIESNPTLNYAQTDYMVKSLLHRLAAGNSVAEQVEWTRNSLTQNQA
ncbi:hypothetical protein [Hymenobacter chitinivorans]|nr:hypothetical protein [Hymenobacter chitinivorans]